MDGEAGGPPSRSRTGAPLGQVSAADQEHVRLDREWTVVHCQRRAGDETACLPDRRLQYRQAVTLAAEAPEEEPQASENGCGGAASLASSEQEAELFDRSFRRPVFRQEIFEPPGRAEISAQGAANARPVERRCQGPISGGRRRPCDFAVRPEARKASVADRRGGLAGAGHGL